MKSISLLCNSSPSLPPPAPSFPMIYFYSSFLSSHSFHVFGWFIASVNHVFCCVNVRFVSCCNGKRTGKVQNLENGRGKGLSKKKVIFSFHFQDVKFVMLVMTLFCLLTCSWVELCFFIILLHFLFLSPWYFSWISLRRFGRLLQCLSYSTSRTPFP